MPQTSAFAFIPDAWDTLQAEAERARQTVSVHPDVARWRAYRVLDMVLATIEAYEGFPPQHRPLAERLTYTKFVQWLDTHPAPVKMWMHRIRQAGMVGAHVDSEWARSVDDARRVVETLHKLLWWLTDTYDAVPAGERPPLIWDELATPEAAAEEATAEAEPDRAADRAAPGGAAPARAASDEQETSTLPGSASDTPGSDSQTSVADASVQTWLRQIRTAPQSAAVQQAAHHLLKHISATNETLLTQLTPDA